MSLPGFARKCLVVAAALPAAAALYFGALWLEARRTAEAPDRAWSGVDASGVARSIFSPTYPQSKRFLDEINLLRATNRLDPANDELIDKLVKNTSAALNMPPALLWCLLFQESRFDHLKGLHEDHRAKGLGQFAYFSFHEINHNLDRFTPDNLKMFVSLLGSDIRPIAPKREQTAYPSSYFYIPTAVASSAAFLNNRYHQLRRVLDRHQISYAPDVLWLYSAMAYNKGTRSVLSFWNRAQARGGRREVERLTLQPGSLFESLDHRERFVQSLAPIWPRETASRYAEELTEHMKQIKECAISAELAESLREAAFKGRRGR